MLSAILIGFMGAGKTTVGKTWAAAEGLPFYDTDDLIQSHTQQTPGEIFAEQGEQTFRAIEHQTLKEMLAVSKGVLATGGGIVENEANLTLLQTTEIPVIYLNAKFGTVAERLMDDQTRPLLQTQSFTDLAQTYQRRKPKYEQSADREIVVDTLSPEAVVALLHA